MKRGVISVLSGLIIFLSLAQEPRTYTDEELVSYGKVMVWVEAEKDRMTGLYNDWIAQNEFVGAPRFLQLKRNQNDSLKLQAINATEDEIAAFNEISSDYDSMTAAFKRLLLGKIREEVGAGLYNALKNDLRTRPEIEARYKDILRGLPAEPSAEAIEN